MRTQKTKWARTGVALALFTTAFSACTSKRSEQLQNVLHLPVGAKIKGLDPAYASDLYSSTEISRTYEGLLGYHYLKRPYELMPVLAAEMPEISPDRKTYTFKLKKGVVFQDDPAFEKTGGKGRELTAEDFVYSFKRLADPRLASTGWWIFDGRVAGLNEWREEQQKRQKTDYSAPVEGLKAKDRYTLEIKLNQPSSQFLYFLAMGFSSAVAREVVEHYGQEFINHPVGTGPFKLQEYQPASKLVWVKNPTFREEYYPSNGEIDDKKNGLLEDAGKRIPFADQVVSHIYVESQPMWLKFLSGDLDSAGIPKDNFEQAITPSKELAPDLKEKGIRLIKRPALDVTHESFNMADPLIGKNKMLRQALSLAYNIDPVIELFYTGRAIPAQGPIPPGLDGYDEKMKNPYREYNLAKAKELLAKAGYPNGQGLPPIEYNTIANSVSRQMTEFLQKSFDKIGVKLKVNSYSWPEFEAALKNRKGQMWGFAWSADYPDAENFLQLFYSKNASPGPNDSNYSNPEFDQLYEKSLTLSPGSERTELYRKMADIVVEDAPWIFGVHRLTYGLTRSWLKNYKPHDFEHNMAKYMRVDLEEKKRRQQ